MAELIAQPHFAAYLTLAVIAGMFVLFVREVFPARGHRRSPPRPCVLASGMIPTDALLSIFSNAAPWTIAAMFILSGGLIRTGVLNNALAAHQRAQRAPAGTGDRAPRRAWWCSPRPS